MVAFDRATESNVTSALLLIDGGADVNVTGTSGSTPLLRAAQLGLTEVVRALLAKGADPNKRAQNELPPLMASLNRRPLTEGNVNIALLLIEGGADVNINLSVPGFSGTPLVQAIQARAPIDVIRALLAKGANPNTPAGSPALGITPLAVAAQANSPEIRQLLIDAGAKP
jgi:ankyrin repeat protein